MGLTPASGLPVDCLVEKGMPQWRGSGLPWGAAAAALGCFGVSRETETPGILYTNLELHFYVGMVPIQKFRLVGLGWPASARCRTV